MLSREEVIEFYCALAEKTGVTVDASVLRMLPPYYCHLLLTDRATEALESDTVSKKLLGHDRDNGYFYHSIYLSTNGFYDPQFSKLLDGHVPLAAPGIFEWLTLALDELREQNRSAWDYIQNWCTVVVWMQRLDERDDLLELTSTSMPRLPFATFVARKIIRHILPKGMLDSSSFYPIQENLYHEALHQQLTHSFLVHDMMRIAPAEGPQVFVPWRGTRWALDRVLHACWVYHGVIGFRVEMISLSQDTELKKALGEHLKGAKDAFSFLLNAVKENSGHFTEDGCRLISHMSAAQSRILSL